MLRLPRLRVPRLALPSDVRALGSPMLALSELRLLGPAGQQHSSMFSFWGKSRKVLRILEELFYSVLFLRELHFFKNSLETTKDLFLEIVFFFFFFFQGTEASQLVLFRSVCSRFCQSLFVNLLPFINVVGREAMGKKRVLWKRSLLYETRLNLVFYSVFTDYL